MALLTSNLIVDTIILASVVLILFYLKCLFSYQYWKQRNIPYLPPTFPFGNLWGALTYRQTMHDAYQEIYNKIKELNLPFAGIFSIAAPQLILTDQELIKQVLIKDFDVFTNRGIFQAEDSDEPLMKNLFSLSGDDWRRLRNKMSPTFTSGRIKEMFPTMDACGRSLVSVLMKNCSRDPNLSVDMKDLLVRYMTDVIGSTVFGIEINVVENPDCEFYRIVQRMSQPNLAMRLRLAVVILLPKLVKLFKLDLMDRIVTTFFYAVVKQNINYRETNNIKRNDFINIMMQMRKSDPDFTDDLVTAQCFVFFTAGFDTSSTVLTHTLHALATDQNLQKRLRQEIWDTKNKYGGELTYDSYQEMTLLDKVIKESLRLYAPLPQLNRTNSKPWTIPNTDITLEPNTNIYIPLYGIHHDPEIYPDPDKFDPERFAPENAENMPHYAWMPFGEGPRNCIGKRFGMVQLKSGLALLISNFEWNTDPDFNKLEYSRADIGFRLTRPLKLRPRPVSQL